MDRRAFLGACAALMTAHPGMAAASPGRSDDFDDFVRPLMRRASLPGLAVGLARAGRTQFVRTYGFADLAARRRIGPDSMFHVASLTKTIVGTAVMKLVDEGRVALDAPIGLYLDFPVVNPAHPGNPITVRHLLMHVSSISDATYYEVDFRTPGRDSPLPLRRFLTDYLVPGGAHYSPGGSFSAAAPGTHYDYSNVGYALLGYLAGRAAGTDLRDYIRDRLFAPLGIGDFSWSIAGTPAPRQVVPYDVADGRLVPIAPVGFPDWPAGMLRISMAGFMAFVAASANGGASARGRMISAGAQAEMLAMHHPDGLPDWLTGQGLAWMESPLGDWRQINHWGGDPGVFTAAYLDPPSRSGVAIFTNCSVSDESRTVIRAIATRLLHGAGGPA
jgi:CubicO group peptidase (beta-lactamase class C family)